MAYPEQTPHPQPESDPPYELTAVIAFFETYGFFPPAPHGASPEPTREVPVWTASATPQELLDHVLSYIEPNGTVPLYAEDGTVEVHWPQPPVDLEKFDPASLLAEALDVASLLWMTFDRRNDAVFDRFPQARDRQLRTLAFFLTRYRHNRAFFEVALLLMEQETLDDTGQPICIYTQPRKPERGARAEQIRQALLACVAHSGG